LSAFSRLQDTAAKHLYFLVFFGSASLSFLLCRLCFRVREPRLLLGCHLIYWKGRYMAQCLPAASFPIWHLGWRSLSREAAPLLPRAILLSAGAFCLLGGAGLQGGCLSFLWGCPVPQGHAPRSHSTRRSTCRGSRLFPGLSQASYSNPLTWCQPSQDRFLFPVASISSDSLVSLPATCSHLPVHTPVCPSASWIICLPTQIHFSMNPSATLSLSLSLSVSLPLPLPLSVCLSTGD
jgi:hypothetical protein